MIDAITHSSIYVLDQDEALDFYVGKLGLEVATTPTGGSCAG
jgi:catechol 2,3-dioxygenase-like lactoylglutathione lyase family enzyme